MIEVDYCHYGRIPNEVTSRVTFVGLGNWPEEQVWLSLHPKSVEIQGRRCYEHPLTLEVVLSVMQVDPFFNFQVTLYRPTLHQEMVCPMDPLSLGEMRIHYLHHS